MRSKTDRMICGTCEYWTGRRKPVFDSRGNPKVDILDETALCENEDSHFTGVSRKCTLNCYQYSKWTEIL